MIAPGPTSSTPSTPSIASPTAAVGDAPLVGGRPSLDALGQAIVDGLNDGDAAALRAVVVDAGDFKGRLFAAVSNHPSAAQMGPDLVWQLQQRESADELARSIERHGGQGLRFQELRPAAREERGEVVLHRRPALVVTDSSGATQTLEFLASVIEHPKSGTFVLLAYKVRG
ncbi:MAG: hypothetical protein R3B09_03990 [Nannocystaceae bacterium]